MSRGAKAHRLRPRTFLAHRAVSLAERWLDRKLVPLEHPVPKPIPRWGHGRPPHARLDAILARGEPAYRRNLQRFMDYRDELARIPAHPAEPAQPWWESEWLPGLDALALYGFLRSRAPAAYFEVGSGMSTMWARRAIADAGAGTRITSIDPAPRAEVDALCDRVLRRPLEEVDLAVFDELAAGDVLFVDGSHRALMNSDATVLLLDVLPRLPAGVLVGIHDVLLPDDYLPEWAGHLWSEQYLVAAYLLAEGPRIELELAAHWAAAHSGVARIADPLWESPGLGDVHRDGFALWLSTATV